MAEMPQAAARDGLFPAPFARRAGPGFRRSGSSSPLLLASGLTVVSYTSFEQVFITVVLLSVLTSVVPVPVLRGRAAVLAGDRRTSAAGLASGPRCRRLRAALVFSFWALAGSGYQAVYYGMFSLLLGVPVYVWVKARRGVYGETSARCAR